jgi:hypothetical protein
MLVLSGAAFAGASAPDWMHEAARTQVGTYPKETAGVVLLDEQVTTVSANGEVHELHRRVIKILSTSGRDLGIASAYYDNDTKLFHFKAWSIPAQGADYEVKDKEAIETAPFDGELYADDKLRLIRIPQAEPGSIVGYEYEQKSRPYLQEHIWSFQGDIPVKKARYSIELPAGWEYQAYWINHAKQEPTATGTRYTWEVNDVPAIKPERGMPATRAVAQKMGLTFFSSAGPHGSWQNVGKWNYQLSFPQRQASPAIQQKVKELIAGKTTAMEKIRALATFMQRDIRYVAIEIGIGGSRPHSAVDVFANRYGDCKDKATLLATMLHEAGIESYGVLAQTNRGVVDSDFPADSSFNHFILAIAIPDSEDLSHEKIYSIVKHPKLGRLMVFDPTDQFTPVGYLPEYTQGNQGLLLTADGGELLPYPLQAPEANELVRTANLTLSDSGELSGEVIERRTGTNAVEYRAELLALQTPQRIKKVESFLSTFLTGFSVKDYHIENLDAFDKELVVHYTFETQNYSKTVGNLVLVRPRVFGSKSEETIDLKERKYAYELGVPTLQEDEFNITVPASLKVDELPDPAKISIAGTTYSSETKMNGNTLAYKRKYQIDQVEVPLDKITDLNSATRVIAMDERTSAVFKKAQ